MASMTSLTKNELLIATQCLGAAAFLRGDKMIPVRDSKFMNWIKELFPNAKIGDSEHKERLALYDNWSKGYTKAQDKELRKMFD